jgi:hypothetical protein
MNRVIKRALYFAVLIVGVLSFYGGKLVKGSLPPISICDKKDTLEIWLEDVGKYHGHICPGATAGFRITQLAISQLWGDETPRRGDFKIISACPAPGPKNAFEFITRVVTRNEGDNFELKLPPGTNAKNISLANWRFTFIRKSTSDSLEIRVKEGIIPEDLFKLKKKVKFGKATPEEENALKSAMQEFKHKCLTLPVNELFAFERR